MGLGQQAVAAGCGMYLAYLALWERAGIKRAGSQQLVRRLRGRPDEAPGPHQEAREQQLHDDTAQLGMQQRGVVHI